MHGVALLFLAEWPETSTSCPKFSFLVRALLCECETKDSAYCTLHAFVFLILIRSQRRNNYISIFCSYRCFYSPLVIILYARFFSQHLIQLLLDLYLSHDFEIVRVGIFSWLQ